MDGADPAQHHALTLGVPVPAGGWPEGANVHVPSSAPLWCLGRSCPCYFRLICAETNMVHFFLGIKSRLEELPGPDGAVEKGPWCPCLSRYVRGGSVPSARVLMGSRTHGVGSPTAQPWAISTQRTGGAGEASVPCQLPAARGLGRQTSRVSPEESPRHLKGARVTVAKTLLQP